MEKIMTKTVIEVYFAKANKVVDSCTNLTQLDGARNYVNNFFSYFGNIEMLTPFKIVNASNFIINCYNELILKVEEKEEILKNEQKTKS